MPGPSARRLVGGVILLAVLLRLPALVYSRGIDDEWVYSVVANEMVYGRRPYVDAVERKPPLLFVVYAAVFQLSGSYDFRALHAAALLWVLATMLGLFLAGRAVWGFHEGLTAAALYAVYVSWGYWRNLAFNGEMLMNLPVVFAMWLVLRWRGNGGTPGLFAAGLLVAVAALLKQPAGVAGAALGLGILIPHLPPRESASTAGRLRAAAALGAGFVAALAAAAWMLHRAGILEEAMYWAVFDHDVPHGLADPVFWWRSLMTVVFATACAPLVGGACVAILERGFYFGDRRREFVILVLCLAAAFIGTAWAGRFYPHYYIQLIPPLALLASPVIAGAFKADASNRGRVLAAGVGVTALVFLALHIYGLATQPARFETARYVEAHSAPDDRIFVWGQAPHLYADAKRRPASRYVMTYPLTGYVFGSPVGADPTIDTSDRILPGSWTNFQADIAEHPPAFIVLEARGTRRYPVEDFPILVRLLEGYELAHRAPDGDVWRRLPL